MSVIFFIVILILCLFIPVMIYNGLISKRNMVDNSFSSIDVQLKRRWELIPNLVETVKGFAVHEKELLENIVTARSTAMQAVHLSTQRLQSEGQLSDILSRLMILSESYPELSSSSHFLNLQRNLTEIESQIAAARRAYNSSILNYNNSIDMFPSNIIAHIGGFTRRPHFDIPHEERKVQSVSL